MLRSVPPATLLLVIAILAPASAQDTVTIRTERGGRATLEGRIDDYDGQALRLVLSGGREQVIPAEKVARVYDDATPPSRRRPTRPKPRAGSIRRWPCTSKPSRRRSGGGSGGESWSKWFGATADRGRSCPRARRSCS